MKSWKKLTTLMLVPAIIFSGYSTYKSRTTLPSCQPNDWYSKSEVTAEEKTVLTDYFAKAHLLPLTFFDARKADRRFMSAGWHECINKGGPNGGYEGFIPANASEGFVVGVVHKADLFGSTNYVQLARIDGKLVVIGSGTSL